MGVRFAAFTTSTWLLASLAAGCVVAVDDASSPAASPAALSDSSHLDAEALDRALANQARLEAWGFVLLGRAWLSERSYTGFYAAPNGVVTVMRFTAPSDLGPADASQPIEHESFEDYAARVAENEPVRLADLAADVLLFAPDGRAPRADVGVTAAALTPLEEIAQALSRCQQSARSVCNPAPGYNFNGRGPQVVSLWDRAQMTSYVGTGRGTSYGIGVCAHATGATVELRYGTPDWGTAPPNVAFDIGPLEQFTQMIFGYWRERRTCGWENIWGTCTEWDFALEFEHMQMTFSASGRNGGIVHSYCGAITQNSNLYYTGRSRDSWCSRRGDCPVPNR